MGGMIKTLMRYSKCCFQNFHPLAQYPTSLKTCIFLCMSTFLNYWASVISLFRFPMSVPSTCLLRLCALIFLKSSPHLPYCCLPLWLTIGLPSPHGPCDLPQAGLSHMTWLFYSLLHSPSLGSSQDLQLSCPNDFLLNASKICVFVCKRKRERKRQPDRIRPYTHTHIHTF